ncbi:MAG: DUF998 domain-containing protein [Cytophagia bacterium]|nr:DUF998 domain-containing protein [Cytophagia bacterium]
MKKRHYAIIGLIIPILFWATYFIMSALRPEFSFKTKAISELGSMDAPNKWFWNFFGYILPGLLISVYGYGLFKAIAQQGRGKMPLISLVLSGLFMTLSGVFPADMDNRQSVTSLLHSVGSMGCYLFFLLGAFTFPKLMKDTAYWSLAIRPTLVFTWLTIFFGGWYFVFPNMPGVGQRIIFFFYLLWIFYTAWKLYAAHATGVRNTLTDPIVK